METPEARWRRWGAAARDGARRAIAEWLRLSRVAEGSVEGDTATLPPGAIRSDADLHVTMLLAMMAGGVPRHVADAFSRTVAEAWTAWFGGYSATLRLPGRLRAGVARDAGALSAARLRASILTRLAQPGEEPGAEEAVRDFSEWLAGAFARWLDGAVLQGVTADPETGLLVRPALRPIPPLE